MTQPFRFRLRVRYGECDAQRVVFNARYADYADLGMTEFFRAIGFSYPTLFELNLDCQVAKLTLEWQAPARFDDVIEIRVRTLKTGNSSFVLGQDIVRPSDETPLCRAEAVYVMMTAEPLEKIRIPDDVRTALETGAPDVVVDQSHAA